MARGDAVPGHREMHDMHGMVEDVHVGFDEHGGDVAPCGPVERVEAVDGLIVATTRRRRSRAESVRVPDPQSAGRHEGVTEVRRHGAVHEHETDTAVITGELVDDRPSDGLRSVGCRCRRLEHAHDVVDRGVAPRLVSCARKTVALEPCPASFGARSLRDDGRGESLDQRGGRAHRVPPAAIAA